MAIPVGIQASRRARHELDGWLSASVGDDLAERVRLAASEIVSNAVRHGALARDDSVRLIVHVDDDTIQVALEQRSAAGAAVIVPPEDRGANGGFGLGIVQEVTDRWGVVDGPPGSVWFEIDRRA